MYLHARIVEQVFKEKVMKHHCFTRVLSTVLTVGLMMQVVMSGCQASGSNKQLPPAQQRRLDAITAEGTRASLTVFPVVMGDSSEFNKGVADVVAVLLLTFD